MSKMFPTAEEQGVQSTMADFLPIAKMFGLGLLGAGAVKGASKLGKRLDDSIANVGKQPMFSPEEWAKVKAQLSAIDAGTKKAGEVRKAVY